MSNNLTDTFSELRRGDGAIRMDSAEHFMRGHQIMKTREFSRGCPKWMRSREEVDAFLLRRFPRRHDPCSLGDKGCIEEQRAVLTRCRPCRHAESALLWNWVIYECFQQGLTAVEAAFDWNDKQSYESRYITPARVRRVIQMIRQAQAGQRLDGKPRSSGKGGRPRKKHACTP
jgi:hypothetical protein